MDRQQELDIIKRTEEFFNNDASVSEMAEWYDKHASDGLKFNQEVANWDALGQIREVDGKKPVASTRPPQKQAAILFMAGTFRCAATRCSHVVPDRQTALHALLGPRVLACEECIPSFGDVIKKYDAGCSGSDECDLCLKRGIKVFHRFSAAWNGFVFFGDVCPECRVLIVPAPGEY